VKSTANLLFRELFLLGFHCVCHAFHAADILKFTTVRASVDIAELIISYSFMIREMRDGYCNLHTSLFCFYRYTLLLGPFWQPRFSVL